MTRVPGRGRDRLAESGAVSAMQPLLPPPLPQTTLRNKDGAVPGHSQALGGVPEDSMHDSPSLHFQAA